MHRAQVLTYMRLLEKKEGLLINFNVPVLKQGITRLLLHDCEADKSHQEETVT